MFSKTCEYAIRASILLQQNPMKTRELNHCSKERLCLLTK